MKWMNIDDVNHEYVYSITYAYAYAYVHRMYGVRIFANTIVLGRVCRHSISMKIRANTYVCVCNAEPSSVLTVWEATSTESIAKVHAIAKHYLCTKSVTRHSAQRGIQRSTSGDPGIFSDQLSSIKVEDNFVKMGNSAFISVFIAFRPVGRGHVPV